MSIGSEPVAQVTKCHHSVLNIILIAPFAESFPTPSKVFRCKRSMQYSIPKCLSHIPNPLGTVPSAPVTIKRLELNDSSKFHRVE